MNIICNESIPSERILLVGYEEAIVEMSKEEALAMAHEMDTDLIQVSSREGQAVCKLMDLGKYLYEKQKRDKKNKKNATPHTRKEIRFSPDIADNDLNVKIRKLREFIQEGNTVKLSLILRGRELTRAESYRQKLFHIAAEVEDVAEIKAGPMLSGRFLTLILVPGKRRRHGRVS